MKAARRGGEFRKVLQARQRQRQRTVAPGAPVTVPLAPARTEQRQLPAVSAQAPSEMTGLEQAPASGQGTRKALRAPGSRLGSSPRVADGVGMARARAAAVGGTVSGAEPTFLTPPTRSRKDVGDIKAPPNKPRVAKQQKKRRTRDKTAKKTPLSSWSAPGAAPAAGAGDGVQGEALGSQTVWRAPQAPKTRRVEKRTVVKKKEERPRKVRSQDLEQAVLEELREEEILVVLQALSTKSPEAQQMLDDVVRRISELRLFDTFRQI